MTKWYQCWRAGLCGLLLVLALPACTTYKYITIKENAFETMDVAILKLAPGEEATQTKDSVTVNVEPVSFIADEFTNVNSSAKRDVDQGQFSTTITTTVTETLVSAFADRGAVPFFKVTIKNDTDHVISPAVGATVAYIPENGQPIAPETAFSGAAATLKGFSAGDAKKYAEQMQAYGAGGNGLALAATLKNLNWVELDPAVKVLPGYGFTGYVFFDVSLLKVGNAGEFKIFDMTTQVDATGAPTKKTAFAFKYNVVKGKASAIGAMGDRASSFKAGRSEREGPPIE